MELKGVEVYQGRNGGIYLIYGGYILLQENQIDELGIDVYKMKNFSLKMYKKFYEKLGEEEIDG